MEHDLQFVFPFPDLTERMQIIFPDPVHIIGTAYELLIDINICQRIQHVKPEQKSICPFHFFRYRKLCGIHKVIFHKRKHL